MAEQFQFREVFNTTVVNKLAQDIQQTWPKFNATGFSTGINSQLKSLSYGDRNALIRDKLAEYLPDQFPDAVQILLNSLGPELAEPDLTGYDGFIIVPQCNYVAKYGLHHFDISMNALYEMTKRFSAEDAIRAFLKAYPHQTVKQMETWVYDKNCHVRRLVSEGTRPRLPMAPRLTQFIKEPTPVLALLEKLKSDPVLLVRRSVANNLNDIAKDNPHLVVETLQKWHQIDDQGTQWIIKHALRTLVKQGNKKALALLGYLPNPLINVQNLTIENSTISVGENLVFHFDLESKAGTAQNLMIDYVIHHMKANGKLAPKIFKLAKKKSEAGQALHLTKTHSFKAISTRKYYPGKHCLEIQINGDIWEKTTFHLKTH